MSVANSTAVQVEELRKSFGAGDARIVALDNLSISIASGEFVAVMGPSGSGKSTILHLIGGLLEPTSGRVKVAGTDLASLDDDALTLLRRHHIGFVFQAFFLLDVFTAIENVALPLIIDGVGEREAHDRAHKALASVQIEDRADHRPNQLSGGEKQRVAIARALVIEPSLLLVDEPTGNLDSRSGDQVMLVLRKLVDDHGHTILMVTHDARNAALADRLLRLRDGCVVEEQGLGRRPPIGEVLGDVEA